MNKPVIPGLSPVTSTFEQTRKQVLEEAHKRPIIPVAPPCRVAHLLYLNESGGDGGAEHVHELLKQANIGQDPASHNDDSCIFGYFKGFNLRWERHTEFSSYTFVCKGQGNSEAVFESALTAVATDWLEKIPGHKLATFELLLTPSLDTLNIPEICKRLFPGAEIYGGKIMSTNAAVWTSFRRDERTDSCLFLLETRSLDEHRSGRLLQNILELESYRLLALLTFPLARAMTPEVREIDLQLSHLVASLSEASADKGEKHLLEKLLGLATAIEKMRANSNYRFNATRAYASLVRKRLALLRETEADKQASLTEFVERRFIPAVETCNAVEGQLKGLSRRITRAGDLLRTRIDLDIQHQNQKLLASMDRRSEIQLRLQQTVEGLSIFAISYYVIGLLAYALKPLQPGKWLIAILVPVIVGGVWLMVRRIRKQIQKNKS